MPSLFDALYEDDKTKNQTVWTQKCLENLARGNLFELMKKVES